MNRFESEFLPSFENRMCQARDGGPSRIGPRREG